MKEKYGYTMYEAVSIYGDPEELEDFNELFGEWWSDYATAKIGVEKRIKDCNRDFIFISEEVKGNKTIRLYGEKLRNGRIKLEIILNKENEDEEDE